MGRRLSSQYRPAARANPEILASTGQTTGAVILLRMQASRKLALELR